MGYFLRAHLDTFIKNKDAPNAARTPKESLYAGLGLTTSPLMSVGKLFMSCGAL